MSLQVHVKGERELRAQFPESDSLADATWAFCDQMDRNGFALVSVTLTTSSQYLFVFRRSPKAEKAPPPLPTPEPTPPAPVKVTAAKK